MAQDFILKNEKIEFALDCKGNLVALKNPGTGYNYASGQPIWRLNFDKNVFKDNQRPSSDNQPVTSKNGNQLQLRYRDETQISVPGYSFKEAVGVGDYSVINGKTGGQNIILGQNGLAVLIYEKK